MAVLFSPGTTRPPPPLRALVCLANRITGEEESGECECKKIKSNQVLRTEGGEGGEL